MSQVLATRALSPHDLSITVLQQLALVASLPHGAINQALPDSENGARIVEIPLDVANKVTTLRPEALVLRFVDRALMVLR